jgi:mannose-6-phosphate isomerase-like protein (cupin superfamily)
MQIVEVQFPAGARVAFESAAHDRRVHQQVWMLGGTMEIDVGETQHRLQEGDCLAMQLGRPVLFRNPTRKPARYAVVTVSEKPFRR